MTDDETVIRVWTFCGIMFAGQLILERYTEYHVREWSTSGYHDYAMVYDGKTAKGSVDGSVPLPRDVIEMAMSMAKWPSH